MEMPIYLDYNATTPLDPLVLEAMMPFLTSQFGNASSSSHKFGWHAEAAVSKAREQVADFLGASSKEIVFTSGATESNNLAIQGLVRKALSDGKTPHIITAATEHKAVLEIFQLADTWGCEVTVLPVDRFGAISAEQVSSAIQDNTLLVSLMAANNEIGTLHPIVEIGSMLSKLDRDNKVLFHVDAAQGAGKFPIDVKAMHIDLLSISGHKMYGPKGVGALYINSEKPKIALEQLIYGGQQEHSVRPGTLNVPGIVGLGIACELSDQHMQEECARLRKLRDGLISKVMAEVPEAKLNGHPSQRLCNNASFSFPGLSPDAFALGLSGLAVSSGSACTSSCNKPSHVLMALGHDESLARSTVRIGLGRFTSSQDIDTAAEKIVRMAKENYAISAS